MADGVTKVRDLVAETGRHQQPALAITDRMNLCGLIKFYTGAMAAGIKPIVGADVYIAHSAIAPNITRITLLVANLVGYKNLSELLSKAYLRGAIDGKPVIDEAWLAQHAEGLIVLSGSILGPFAVTFERKEAQSQAALLSFYQEHFNDRFYMELTRTNRSAEFDFISRAVPFAAKHGIPLVATNDVVFARPELFEVHEVRVAIHDGYTLEDKRRPRNYSEQQYLRSSEEMCELFHDLPSAISNTITIATRCTLELNLGSYYLPNFPTGNLTVEQYLIEKSKDGLEQRLIALFPDPEVRETHRDAYIERLMIELEVINNMGFPGYFLIVMEFIQWSKDQGIPVGPGRGSGAGSLVAYALKITDLDPLAFDLLFERFLNPERVSMPDFDIDFCMERRDEVIEHVADLYGRDAVAQIITFGTMAAKAVVRDVGRVLGYPYGFVDKISKLIPPTPGMTLTNAFTEEPRLEELYQQDDEVQTLMDMARQLEGVTRNAGKHAGGVVISPTTITDFSPLYCDDHGRHPVTQFDKNDVETAGLVKFDFLGLRTLTIIQWAIEMIAQSKQVTIDINAIPLVDKAAFDLLQSAKTTAVFQLESSGMKDLIRRLKPDCFEDIIALVALFRPGPLQSGMVDNFIDRKQGRETISYPDATYQHDSLKDILEPTYGIILYQEQVMQIAQVMSGYSLGEADLLRRAMGKKKPEEMAKQRAIFQDGAKANGIDPDLSMKIFDLVEKFAGYGFNKSHSAAYALVSYQTLWLKTHYPAEFMAAVMSADMDNTDKIVALVDEVNSLGLKVLPPDVNQGAYKFTVSANGELIYGIGAIKGVGEGPIENIIQARDQGGQFSDLFDFCQRVDTKKLNRRVVENLILSGAMDGLGPDRATMFASLKQAIDMAQQAAQAEQSGQADFFGITVERNEQTETAFVNVAPWSEKTRLAGEKETLGLYLTGHPINAFKQDLQYFTDCHLADIKPHRKDVQTRVAGCVLATRVMTNKKGRRWAIISLDDKTARVEARVYPDNYERFEALLQNDALLLVSGQVVFDDYSECLTLNVQDVVPLEQAREHHVSYVLATCDMTQMTQTALDRLVELLGNYRGGTCPLRLRVIHHEFDCQLSTDERWLITLDDQLLNELTYLLGPGTVSLSYH